MKENASNAARLCPACNKHTLYTVRFMGFPLFCTNPRCDLAPRQLKQKQKQKFKRKGSKSNGNNNTRPLG